MSSIIQPMIPKPQALYDGELGTNAAAAGAINTCYLVAVVLNAPAVLTGVRVRFLAGGAGHYDVGIYDATGASGAPNNLLAHAAATATSLVTSSAALTPALIGGNLTLAPGRYWLALWIDNATDTITRPAAGSIGVSIVQSGTNAGPLPALASSIAGLADGSFKPSLVGILQGGFS